MNEPAFTARPCRCERPVLDGETCWRCGRSLKVLPEPALPGPPARRPVWTRARVIRALRAFAFFRGRLPVENDLVGRSGDNWPARETVIRLFGSVEAAVEISGRG